METHGRAPRPSLAQRAQRFSDRSAFGEWLVYCADPLALQKPAPKDELSPELHAMFVEEAARHGVLSGVLRHLPAFRGGDERVAEVEADARRRHRASLVMGQILRRHAAELLAEAAGEPVTLIKGPAFAGAIYPDQTMRSFTDIDLLAAKEALPRLAEILGGRGFRLDEETDPQARQEWKWLHRDNHGIMVEVQTDLVHSPALSRAVSVTYADLLPCPDSPVAHLLVALVHGAKHHFKRLQHIVDICQAARCLKSDNESDFEEMVGRTRARFVAVTGLRLTSRLFAEPRCLEIADAIGSARHGRLAELLVSRSVATTTMSDFARLYSWRLNAYRALIKLNADDDGA